MLCCAAAIPVKLGLERKGKTTGQRKRHGLLRSCHFSVSVPRRIVGIHRK